jgi:hypothetical protein
MRLSYKNNWEADQYFVDKKLVSDITKVRIKGVEYTVTSAEEGVPYNDMGHTYTGWSKHYYIRTKVFGIWQEFDLNKLVDKVPVSVLKYTLAK